MSKKNEPSDSFTLQLRISMRNSPDLYERLTRGLEAGESQGSVLRRLAEEALLLRKHPLIAVMQGLDFKGIIGKETINEDTALINRSQSNQKQIQKTSLMDESTKVTIDGAKDQQTDSSKNQLTDESTKVTLPADRDNEDPTVLATNKKTDASGAFANLLVSRGLVK